jgi:hypothetical protein
LFHENRLLIATGGMRVENSKEKFHTSASMSYG